MVRIILLLILAIFYILAPIDLIPDRIGRIGRIDDFGILLAIVWWFFFKPLYDEMKGKIGSRNHHNSINSKFPNDKHSEVLTPYEILGISEHASTREVKKAYYDLIKQYHPDLVNNMGVEIQKVASQKTEQINSAYEELMQK